MNIFDKAFRLLPKSVQVPLLLEDLKRVDAYLEYHRGQVGYFQERSNNLRSRLYELGEKIR